MDIFYAVAPYPMDFNILFEDLDFSVNLQLCRECHEPHLISRRVLSLEGCLGEGVIQKEVISRDPKCSRNGVRAGGTLGVRSSSHAGTVCSICRPDVSSIVEGLPGQAVKPWEVSQGKYFQEQGSR